MPSRFTFTILFGLLHFWGQGQNVLSSQEKKEGWTLLFNGRNTSGWHTYGGGPVGSAWRVEDGALHLYVPNRVGNKAANGGDLVTDATFSGDFEFKADWKVGRLTNSGIFFFVQETPAFKNVYDTGLELQVLDNAIYGDADENTHRAGDFFSVANARVREVNPVGEWNQVHFVMKKNRLTVSMNGYTIHEYDLNGPEWKGRVAGSKLNTAPLGKGQYSGRIGLQDWGSTVWFRNVKIRRL